MNWKYLVIGVAKIRGGTKLHLQFEVSAETVSDAEKYAKALLAGYFEIDVIEIRRT